MQVSSTALQPTRPSLCCRYPEYLVEKWARWVTCDYTPRSPTVQ